MLHKQWELNDILFKCFVELIERENIKLWERNLLETVKMAVLSDDIVSSEGDGTVHELVVVLVNVRKQMEAKVGLAINGLGVACDSVNHVLCHLR